MIRDDSHFTIQSGEDYLLLAQRIQEDVRGGAEFSPNFFPSDEERGSQERVRDEGITELEEYLYRRASGLNIKNINIV